MADIVPHALHAPTGQPSSALGAGSGLLSRPLTAPYPAPTETREVLELFRFYHPETGLEGLLENVDLRGVLPRQIYHAVHARPPESVETALAERQYPIDQIFAAALRSIEFRQRLVINVLGAYPEKTRLIFIHIPKCAGSNLSAHLIGRFASLNTNLLDPGLTPEPAFFLALKHLVLELAVSDTIYIHGHNHLQTFHDWQAIRLRDTVFTVLRHPADLVLSQVNYVLSRIFSPEHPISADTAGWRDEFAVRDLSFPGPEVVADLAHRILAHRGVVPANVMAQFLGHGTAETAIAHIVTHHIEVTEMSHYGTWCHARWGIERHRHVNASHPYFKLTDLSLADRALIATITEEDTALHQQVTHRLATLGTASLTGRAVLST
jgi:hypothetical protein